MQVKSFERSVNHELPASSSAASSLATLRCQFSLVISVAVTFGLAITVLQEIANTKLVTRMTGSFANATRTYLGRFLLRLASRFVAYKIIKRVELTHQTKMEHQNYVPCLQVSTILKLGRYNCLTFEDCLRASFLHCRRQNYLALHNNFEVLGARPPWLNLSV